MQEGMNCILQDAIYLYKSFENCIESGESGKPVVYIRSTFPELKRIVVF